MTFIMLIYNELIPPPWNNCWNNLNFLQNFNKIFLTLECKPPLQFRIIIISLANKNLLEKSQRFCFNSYNMNYPLDLRYLKSQKLYLKTEICDAKPDRIKYYIFLIGKNKFDPRRVMTNLTPSWPKAIA